MCMYSLSKNIGRFLVFLRFIRLEEIDVSENTPFFSNPLVNSFINDVKYYNYVIIKEIERMGIQRSDIRTLLENGIKLQEIQTYLKKGYNLAQINKIVADDYSYLIKKGFSDIEIKNCFKKRISLSMIKQFELKKELDFEDEDSEEALIVKNELVRALKLYDQKIKSLENLLEKDKIITGTNSDEEKEYNINNKKESKSEILDVQMKNGDILNFKIDGKKIEITKGDEKINISTKDLSSYLFKNSMEKNKLNLDDSMYVSERMPLRSPIYYTWKRNVQDESNNADNAISAKSNNKKRRKKMKKKLEYNESVLNDDIDTSESIHKEKKKNKTVNKESKPNFENTYLEFESSFSPFSIRHSTFYYDEGEYNLLKDRLKKINQNEDNNSLEDKFPATTISDITYDNCVNMLDPVNKVKIPVESSFAELFQESENKKLINKQDKQPFDSKNCKLYNDKNKNEKIIENNKKDDFIIVKHKKLRNNSKNNVYENNTSKQKTNSLIKPKFGHQNQKNINKSVGLNKKSIRNINSETRNNNSKVNVIVKDNILSNICRETKINQSYKNRDFDNKKHDEHKSEKYSTKTKSEITTKFDKKDKNHGSLFYRDHLSKKDQQNDENTNMGQNQSNYDTKKGKLNQISENIMTANTTFQNNNRQNTEIKSYANIVAAKSICTKSLSDTKQDTNLTKSSTTENTIPSIDSGKLDNTFKKEFVIKNPSSICSSIKNKVFDEEEESKFYDIRRNKMHKKEIRNVIPLVNESISSKTIDKTEKNEEITKYISNCTYNESFSNSEKNKIADECLKDNNSENFETFDKLINFLEHSNTKNVIIGHDYIENVSASIPGFSSLDLSSNKEMHVGMDYQQNKSEFSVIQNAYNFPPPNCANINEYYGNSQRSILTPRSGVSAVSPLRICEPHLYNQPTYSPIMHLEHLNHYNSLGILGHASPQDTLNFRMCIEQQCGNCLLNNYTNIDYTDFLKSRAVSISISRDNV